MSIHATFFFLSPNSVLLSFKTLIPCEIPQTENSTEALKFRNLDMIWNNTLKNGVATSHETHSVSISINKSTRWTFCMYLFCNSTCFKDHFVHHQQFMIYSICSSVQTVQTCLTARSYGCSKQLTEQLGTFAWFVQSCRYSKFMNPWWWTKWSFKTCRVAKKS